MYKRKRIEIRDILPLREIIILKPGKAASILLTQQEYLNAKIWEIGFVLMYNGNKKHCTIKMCAYAQGKIWHESPRIKLKKNTEVRYSMINNKRTVVCELEFKSYKPVLMLVIVRLKTEIDIRNSARDRADTPEG